MSADPRLAMTRAERIEAWRRLRASGPPRAEELAIQASRPWQRCPDCGRTEAAHWWCSGCFLPMGPGDWLPTVATEAKLAALDAARGRPRAGGSFRPGAARPVGVVSEDPQRGQRPSTAA